MPRSRTTPKNKHLCYYGYVRNPWYRISCPICKKVLTGNLPMMIFAAVLVLSISVVGLMVLFKI